MSEEAEAHSSVSQSTLFPRVVYACSGDEQSSQYLEQVKYRYVQFYQEKMLEFIEYSLVLRRINSNNIACQTCQCPIQCSREISLDDAEQGLLQLNKYLYNVLEYTLPSNETKVQCKECLQTGILAVQASITQCMSMFEAHAQSLVTMLSSVAVLSLYCTDVTDNTPCSTFQKDGVVITRYVPEDTRVIEEYTYIHTNITFRSQLALFFGFFVPLRAVHMIDGVLYICDMPMVANTRKLDLDYILRHPSVCTVMNYVSLKYNAVLPGYGTQMEQELATTELLLTPSYMHSVHCLASVLSLSIIPITYELVHPTLPFQAADPAIGHLCQYHTSLQLSEHLIVDIGAPVSCYGVPAVTHPPVLATAVSKDHTALRTLAYFLDEGTISQFHNDDQLTVLISQHVDVQSSLRVLYSICQSTGVRQQISIATCLYLARARIQREKQLLLKSITSDYRSLHDPSASTSEEHDGVLLESYQHMMSKYDTEIQRLYPLCIDDVKRALQDQTLMLPSISLQPLTTSSTLRQTSPIEARLTIDGLVSMTCPWTSLSPVQGRYSHLTAKCTEQVFQQPSTASKIRIIGEKVDQLVKRVRLTVNSIRLDRKKEQITVKNTTEQLEKIGCGPKDAILLAVMAVQLTNDLPKQPSTTQTQLCVTHALIQELAQMCTTVTCTQQCVGMPTSSEFHTVFVKPQSLGIVSHQNENTFLQYCFKLQNYPVYHGVSFLLHMQMNTNAIHEVYTMAYSFLKNTVKYSSINHRGAIQDLLHAPFTPERNITTVKVATCLWLFEILVLLQKLQSDHCTSIFTYQCLFLLEVVLEAPVPLTMTGDDTPFLPTLEYQSILTQMIPYDLPCSHMTDHAGVMYVEQHDQHPTSLVAQWSLGNSTKSVLSSDLVYTLQKEAAALPYDSNVRTIITTYLAFCNELRGVLSIYKTEYHSLLQQLQTTISKCNDNMAQPYLLHQMERITVQKSDESFEYNKLRVVHENIVKLTKPPQQAPPNHTTIALQLAKTMYNSLQDTRKHNIRTILTQEPTKKHAKLGADRLQALLTRYTTYLTKKYE